MSLPIILVIWLCFNFFGQLALGAYMRRVHDGLGITEQGREDFQVLVQHELLTMLGQAVGVLLVVTVALPFGAVCMYRVHKRFSDAP